jgi:hypothetical protein
MRDLTGTFWRAAASLSYFKVIGKERYKGWRCEWLHNDYVAYFSADIICMDTEITDPRKIAELELRRIK